MYSLSNQNSIIQRKPINILALNTRLTNNETTVNALNTRLTNNETNVNTLNTLLTNNEIIVNEINVNALNTLLTNNQTTVYALDTRLINNETTVNSLNTRLINNETTVYALDTRLINNETTLNALNTRLTNNETYINTLNTRTTNNETTVNTLNTRLTNNETTVNTLDTRVTDNETDMYLLKNMVTSFIPTSILSKIKKSVCQMTVIINDSYYIGSGWYYYDTDADLSNGYFITAAHCVMLITNGVYYKAQNIYLQNPINNKWTSIDVNNIYIDGVADIALIRTNINLTNYPEYCLKISNDTVNDGDICYVVGNPGGYDEDSISVGFVRDANYCDPTGQQITNSIYINAPSMSGNSGGPIINKNGEAIGIYTFGLGGHIECLGGGSNNELLKLTLTELKKGINNKSKLYLGLYWKVPNPFLTKDYYPNQNEFDAMGVYIISISSLSPFNGILSIGDLLLSCTVTVTNTTIQFGNMENQRTLGVLLYYPINTEITITYIKVNTTNIITTNVILNKSYDHVSDLLDGPLQRGSSQKIIL